MTKLYTERLRRDLRVLPYGGGLSLLGRPVSDGPATYTISGTITGDEVEGVSIALTGDATDSTTTAADGTYSFTGLDSGSYTVTPTYTNLQMAPVSSAVTVSGTDQTGVDFVAQYLLLPYTYDFSDLAAADGTALGTADANFPISVVDGNISQQLSVSTSDLTDEESYTPNGVEKVALANSLGDSAEIGNTLKLPYSFPSGTSIRVGILVKSEANNRGGIPLNFHVTAGRAAPELRNAYLAKGTTGKTYIQGVYSADGANEVAMNYPAVTGNVGGGGTVTGDIWLWLLGEWNWTDGKIRSRVIRAKDGKGYYTEVNMGELAADSGGPFPFEYFTLRHVDTSDAARDARVAKIWIGTASDDWPV